MSAIIKAILVSNQDRAWISQTKVLSYEIRESARSLRCLQQPINDECCKKHEQLLNRHRWKVPLFVQEFSSGAHPPKNRHWRTRDHRRLSIQVKDCVWHWRDHMDILQEQALCKKSRRSLWQPLCDQPRDARDGRLYANELWRTFQRLEWKWAVEQEVSIALWRRESTYRDRWDCKKVEESERRHG